MLNALQSSEHLRERKIRRIFAAKNGGYTPSMLVNCHDGRVCIDKKPAH